MLDYNITVQSQYKNSPKLLKLLDGLNALIDPSKDIELFFSKYFLVNNAEGIVLDIWGRIVGVERIIKEYFSFFGQNSGNFNNANFYTTDTRRVYELPDLSYKIFILLKIGANIAASNVESINSALRGIFPNRQVYVLETAPMQLCYIFESTLSEDERLIIEEIDILPTGAGVGIEYLELAPDETFGFLGSEMLGFDQDGFMERGKIVLR